MFAKIINNEIVAYATFKKDDSYIETEKNIVEGFDHKFYFEEDTLSKNYISRYQEYVRKQEINKSIKQLENWFDNYFDKQLKQSLWQEDFKPSYDKYFDCEYTSLDQLKAKAQEVRQNINTLRLEVENGNA